MRRPGFRRLFGKVINLGNFLKREMTRPSVRVSSSSEELIESLFPGMKVAHGPFKGMLYPDAKAYGSSLFPKLIGSYERELHPVINRMMSCGYSDVVDVGCAEGYYAVGFALLLPEANVHAYDISSEARELCRMMAEVNGVSDRVCIHSECTEGVLCSHPLGQRALIICDCEGYEKSLLSESVIQKLKQHDFLVEAHDFVDRSISPTMIDRFRLTHKIELIKSIPDHLKAGLYAYNELNKFDKSTQFALLEEKRLESMNWFYMKTRC